MNQKENVVCSKKGGQLQGELAKDSYTAELAPIHSKLTSVHNN